MFITYISQWLYTVMQLPIPIVLSPTQVYSITIWNLFIGTLLLGIFLLLVERAFDGMRYSDFRVKDTVPTTEVVSSSYDNIGRRRFYGDSARTRHSIAQRILNRRKKENIGVRLVNNKSDTINDRGTAVGISSDNKKIIFEKRD